MLRPDQFEVGEAWVVFKLNDAPIVIQAEGDFDCVALMDAASMLIVASEFIERPDRELSKAAVRGLLDQAKARGEALPKTFLIMAGLRVRYLEAEAKRLCIASVRVPQDQLLHIIGEALTSFGERFGR